MNRDTLGATASGAAKDLNMTTTPQDQPPRASLLHTVRTGPSGGNTVVLLHSAGLDLTYWDAQIAALRTDYDIFAIDLPGHGRSAGVAQDWVGGNVLQSLESAIDAAGCRPIHLVGLSLGGMLAQQFAAAHPDRLASLTLIDTAASFTQAGREAMRARAQTAREGGMSTILDSLTGHWFTAATLRDRPDLVDRAINTLLTRDPSVHAAIWEFIATFEALDQLPLISCPTLVLVGEHDSSSPVSSARQLRDGIPDARLRVIPDTAHLSVLEKPALVTEHLKAFLCSVA